MRKVQCSWSCSFRRWFSRCQQKKFSCSLHTLDTWVLKDNKSFRNHKTVEIKVLVNHFCLLMEGSRRLKTYDPDSTGKVYLKVLTNEKRGGLTNYHSIGLPFSHSRWDCQTNRCRPHPVRGLKLLSEPCFCHLKSMIVSQYRHSVGLRHTFHIVRFIETTLLYNVHPPRCVKQR